LETIFKSFGSYFIRRRYREPLYHAVLERYVQLITRNGVTQGLFPEGGLSRDGRFQPAKIGLLDYIVGTLREPGFDRDIWLVPVALNYDRTLEDRVLIQECLDPELRLSRVRQASSVIQYLSFNTARFVAGRLKRYGRAAVNFGTPLSVRSWLASQATDVLALPRPERLPHVQRLADDAMERVRIIVPVTAVALASAALLSFERHVVTLPELLERMREFRDRLLEVNAKVVRADRSIEATWAIARRMFRMRHVVLVTGSSIAVMPRQRPLLEYYANSIAHLLPEAEPARRRMTPADDRDASLHRLREPPKKRRV
jgi:glycerol-3-phosphate O-acyltransferase